MARAGRTYPARPLLGHPPLTLAPQPGPPPPVSFTLQAWPPQGQWSAGQIQGQWTAGAPVPEDSASAPRPVP